MFHFGWRRPCTHGAADRAAAILAHCSRRRWYSLQLQIRNGTCRSSSSVCEHKVETDPSDIQAATPNTIELCYAGGPVDCCPLAQWHKLLQAGAAGDQPAPEVLLACADAGSAPAHPAW